MKTLFAWLDSRSGSTATEYSLIVGAVAIAVIATIFLMGDSLEAVFNTLADEMSEGVAKL